MTMVHRISPHAAKGVEIVEDAADLNVFCQSGTAGAIWRRDTPKHVQDWLESLPEDRLPRGRLILRPDALAKAITALCDAHCTPKGPERDWLEHDIAHVAKTFAGLIDPPNVRLRIDVITTNACRKFHIDAIQSRVVCTYRGTGTQYGNAPRGNEPKRVFTVATGSPIFLRGTLWPETPPAELLHRSPPIEGTGETRLVLVVDPIFDPETEV